MFRVCAGSGEIPEDELLRARAALPISLNGLGLRSLVDVTPAAFVGGCWQVHHRLIDREVAGSTQPVPGHAPCLSALFGQGAFDTPAGRHTGLLGGTSPSQSGMPGRVVDA